MYRRRQDVLKNLKACFTPPLVLPEQTEFFSDFCINENWVAASKYDAQELLAEYKNLKAILKESSGDLEILDLFPDVGFLADLNDEETKRLLQYYSKIKFEISNAFLSNDFLEAVVCKMAQD